MTLSERQAYGDPALRSLGLVTNPFRPVEEDGDPLTIRLAVHAAAARALAAMEAEAERDRAKPVWIGKSQEIPGYYHVAATAEVLSVTADGDAIGVLATYIPLDLFKIGRVRSALSSAAERIAASRFDLTLAAYLASEWDRLDETLPERGALADAGVDLDAVRDSLRADPAGTIEGLFGEFAHERRRPDQAERRMEEAFIEASAQETDPDEGETAAEAEPEDADGVGLPAVDSREGGEVEEAEPQPSAEELLVAYFVAHVRASLSPVVARAVAAYRTDGALAVAEQLKLTKAPKKTLAAIASFATRRFRKLALIYDRFDSWPALDPEVRAYVAASVSELRMRAGGDLLLVFAVAEGLAPELAEQLSDRHEVRWDWAELPVLEAQPVVTSDIARTWFESASLPSRLPREDGALFAQIVEASGGEPERFAAMAAAAVDDAAARGVTALDEQAVAAAKAAGTG